MPINKEELIVVREEAELRIISGDKVSIFSVRVQDVTENQILIDRPVIDRQLFPQVIGNEVEIWYKRSDAKFSFKTRVIEQKRIGALPVLVLEIPQQITRTRPKLRRQSLRLRVPAEIIIFPAGDSEEERRYCKGQMIDVSAGGVKFSIPTEDTDYIQLGDLICVTFNLSERVFINEQRCRVLKAKPFRHDPARREVVCRYLDISKQLQEAIIVHNVKYQRRYRIVQKEVKDS